MKKKCFVYCMVLMFSFVLPSCGNSQMSDYQLWKNSDDAIDLNGDRRINELDYQLYLNPPLSAYETWRNSEDSEDLNGDRKIDGTDYELYLNPPPTAYELWADSEDAADLNNDSQINAADYELFLNPPPSAYEVWRNSEDSEDLNGDRKINEVDYDLFINPPPSAYELWLDSTEAEDLNNDTLINEDDYELFVDFHQFTGMYVVENYTYEGEENIVFDSYQIFMEDVHQYLPQIVFTVDINKHVTVTIPPEVQTKIEDNYAIFEQVIQNLVLTKISNNLLAMDVSFQYSNREFHLSLYFQVTSSGLLLNYTALDVKDNTILFIINFDLVKQ